MQSNASYFSISVSLPAVFPFFSDGVLLAAEDYEESFGCFIPEIDDVLDELVKKRNNLGEPLCLDPSCAIADRPLLVDGLSFVQHAEAFQDFFEAGMRHPIF